MHYIIRHVNLKRKTFILSRFSAIYSRTKLKQITKFSGRFSKNVPFIYRLCPENYEHNRKKCTKSVKSYSSDDLTYMRKFIFMYI